MAAADVLGVRTLHLQNAEMPKRQDPEPADMEGPEEQWIKVNEGWLGDIK